MVVESGRCGAVANITLHTLTTLDTRPVLVRSPLETLELQPMGRPGKRSSSELSLMPSTVLSLVGAPTYHLESRHAGPDRKTKEHVSL